MEAMQNERNRVAAQRSWLLIDCAHQGEVRLTHATPSRTPVLGQIYRYESAIPTFTDVLLRFQQESRLSLLDLQPVIAIAGVPSGQSMSIERSRWVISRAGLASLFGTPPEILNEVAAQAWALRGSLQGVTPVLGNGAPDLARPGRYVFLTYEEGVGTAILDIDDHGRCTVLDGEGGQIDFVPVDDAERSLIRPIAARGAVCLSWEQVLMTRRGAPDAASSDSNQLFARLLGRFVSNLVYVSGAWNGAFMTGRLIPRLEAGTDFRHGLSYQRPYHRLLDAASCWRVAQSEAVLKGCAAMLAARLGPG
jgi:glucokinase